MVTKRLVMCGSKGDFLEHSARRTSCYKLYILMVSVLYGCEGASPLDCPNILLQTAHSKGLLGSKVGSNVAPKTANVSKLLLAD